MPSLLFTAPRYSISGWGFSAGLGMDQASGLWVLDRRLLGWFDRLGKAF